MGQIFSLTEQYLPNINSGSVFVEIGSDRWEGSTEYFVNLASKNNTTLHTVDIDPDPQSRHQSLLGVQWHCAIGSEWAKNEFPKLNKTISCLYLDNFDYDWETTQHSSMIANQQELYRSRFNVEMTNQNCQIEHMTQMLALYPYMEQHSAVICDDTYLYNECWIGKSGPVVVFLLANGYTIAHMPTHNNLGVILVR
jgi:hypothetical protein